MRCKLCGNNNIKIAYNGIIRDGGLDSFTNNQVKILQCDNCDVMWHDSILDNEKYYESKEYRESLEGTTKEEDFYRLHDKESLDKFEYTGTTIFRNGVVADIGCGCGAFLDYLKGVAKEIVAIEPSQYYREIMNRKGFKTYGYAADAVLEYKEKMDVVISFDVIEHVEDPKGFVKDITDLLKPGGKAIIGTPTETPIMRSLLGDIYERKLLFSTQHIWVLGEKSLKYISKEVGYEDSKIEFKYYQRYGLGNMMGWLREKMPRSDISEKWITKTLDEVWKRECEKQKMSDYIVLYLEK